MSARDFDGHGRAYALLECAVCGLVRTHPAPVADLLQQAYAADYYGKASRKFVPAVERWTLHAARRRAKAMLASHAGLRGRLRILDIGCGRGVLLDAFRSLGHEVLGTERKGSPFGGRPDVKCGGLDELNLAAGSFDIIVLWHVLEHLEDPAATLELATGLLKDSGSLFVSVPNFGSWQARLFGSSWFHLDLPRHLFHFDDRSLGAILARARFTIRDRSTFVPDQNLYGFVQSALNRLPGLEDNHLYKLLRTSPSMRSVIAILAYLPLVGVLLLAAVVELAVSGVQGRGAVLAIRATKIAHD